MKIEYFGTSLTEKGHYLRNLNTETLDHDYCLSFKHLPFNPEELNKNQQKGDVVKVVIEDYKVISICGSCIDTRGVCKSVFMTKEDVSLEELELYLKQHPYCIKMFEQMPFDIKW